MILTINGKQATLKKGSSIEYVSENRIFTAALNAYSSAAAIPVVGYIIAPIAAAMAVAAGAMQVAAIKK